MYKIKSINRTSTKMEFRIRNENRKFNGECDGVRAECYFIVSHTYTQNTVYNILLKQKRCSWLVVEGGWSVFFFSIFFRQPY